MNPQALVKKLIDSGVTQEQLAEKTQTTQTTISRIYLGKTTDPRWSLGQRINEVARELRPDIFQNQAA